MAERLFRNSKFVFVGKLQEGKNLVTDEKMGQSEWMKKRMSLAVKEGGNSQFLSMEFIHNPSVKTVNIFGKDGSMFKVDMSETVNDDVVEKSADFTRIVVDLETDFEKKKEYTSLIFKRMNHLIKKDEEKTDEDLSKIEEYTKQIKELATNRKEFCTMNDVIDFIEKAFPIMKDKQVKVTGSVKNNYYNGKNVFQYVPSSIEFVPEDTESELTVYLDVFFTNDSLEDDIKNKKMFINGYVGERVKKVDTLFPQTFVIDYTKIDMNNEQHKMLLDYLKSTFAIIDKKMVHKIGLEIAVVNGAEVIEFNEDCLTEKQKMELKLGFHDLNYFRPKGNIFGDRVQELKVITGDFKTYPEGAVTVINKSDLGEYLFKEQQDVTKDEVKNNTQEEEKEEKSSEQSTEELMKALFK